MSEPQPSTATAMSDELERRPDERTSSPGHRPLDELAPDSSGR